MSTDKKLDSSCEWVRKKMDWIAVSGSVPLDGTTFQTGAVDGYQHDPGYTQSHERDRLLEFWILHTYRYFQLQLQFSPQLGTSVD